MLWDNISEMNKKENGNSISPNLHHSNVLYTYFMLNTLRNYETDHGCMFDCHKFPFNSDLINFMV